MASWDAVLRDLYALASRGIEPGLERVREALGRIGDPQESFGVVHVAGTNGKGSTAKMIAEGIVDPGVRVGLFTSPHLHSLTERFVVDGQPVTRAELAVAWTELAPRIAHIPLTFFETITVLAFELFRARGVHIAVLETGLGGRLDATNIVERPIATAITRIALDHQSWLGDTLGMIAAEKAGIMKPGVPCVVGPQEPEVDAVIDEVAGALGAPLIRPRFDGRSSTLHVRWDPWISPLLSLHLAGDHQHENLAVAVGALFAIDEACLAIVDATRAADARWPGRAETIWGRPGFIFDVGHNPNGARALSAYLEQCEGGPGPWTLVFGAMKDKDYMAMLRALRPHVSHVILTSPKLGRAAEPERMAQAGDLIIADVAEAVDEAKKRCMPEGFVIVTGSTFVVAEARAKVLGVENDPPIAF